MTSTFVLYVNRIKTVLLSFLRHINSDLKLFLREIICCFHIKDYRNLLSSYFDKNFVKAKNKVVECWQILKFNVKSLAAAVVQPPYNLFYVKSVSDFAFEIPNFLLKIVCCCYLQYSFSIFSILHEIVLLHITTINTHAFFIHSNDFHIKNLDSHKQILISRKKRLETSQNNG